MPIEIPREVLAITGMAIIGFVGHNVFVEIGNKTMATTLAVILELAAGSIVCYFLYKFFKYAAAVFDVHIG